MIEDSGCRGCGVLARARGRGGAGAARRRSARPAVALRGAGDARSRIASAPRRSSRTARRPTDDCFWLYSSGSTGFPKGAVHAHRDLAVVSQRYGVETLGIGAGDVCYSAAKLFFAYGLGNSLTFPLWVGAIVGPVAGAADARDHVRAHRALPSHASSSACRRSTPASSRRSSDRSPTSSSLRYCVSAGEALPPALFERWRERTGLLILDGIGSTEALHIFIANTPREWKPGTSGRPIAGYEARIVDDAGRAGRAQGRRARSRSAATRPRSTTGTSPRRRATPCSPAAGSRPATPTGRTTRASSSTKAAPTT